MLLLHASCVSLKGDAVILRGPPGAGKSDLALRLIDEGAQLIADDQVAVERRGEQQGGLLVARPPKPLAGLVEVRGLGILRLPHASEGPVVLIVDLDPGGTVERLPGPAVETLLGIALPRITLDPFHASATARLRAAVAGLRDGTIVVGAVPEPSKASA